MFTTDLQAAMQRKRSLTEAEAWSRATPQQRHTWWPAGEPTDAKAHSYGAGAGWGASPAAPGPVDLALTLAAVADLEEQERWASAVAYGRIAEQTEASLMAWAVSNKPAIHVMPAKSEASRRNQALADLDVLRGEHR
jgi:hypothetical protein